MTETPVKGKGSSLSSLRQLEELLNAHRIRWCYTGGYAFIVWARAGEVVGEIPPTSDYDILVHPDDQSAIYTLLFGSPEVPETSLYLEERKLTFFFVEVETIVPLGSARVVNLQTLRKNNNPMMAALKRDPTEEDKKKAAKRQLRYLLLMRMSEGDIISKLNKKPDDDKGGPGGGGSTGVTVH